MDADTLFLSYLAILVIVAIVLAVMKKRRPGWAWNTSPAWYATLTVACGLLPLQIYLLWDGDAPTTSFIVLCVVADVGVWLLMYFVSKKRQLPRGDLPGRDISGGY